MFVINLGSLTVRMYMQPELILYNYALWTFSIGLSYYVHGCNGPAAEMHYIRVCFGTDRWSIPENLSPFR